MKSFVRFLSSLVLAGVVSIVSGCGLFSGQLDQAADGAGRLVTFYCENVTLPEIREEFRVAVNAKSSPHSVSVACADGGLPLIVGNAPTP